MASGKLKYINKKMGYGFISDDKTGKDLLFFISGIDPDFLNINDALTFDMIHNTRAARAANVQKVMKEYLVNSQLKSEYEPN